MKLIIDIDEKWEAKCSWFSDRDIMDYLYGVCRNGTPLPKGHGRLIDADALPLNAIDDANYGNNYIRIAPTIIEADKETINETDN